MNRRIYLSAPHVGDDERALLLDAFDSNWIAPLGPHVDAFETELAARTGTAHVAALASGTAALHLALRLLNVGRDDTVFVSSLTFCASANPVVYQGATPIFIDSDQSWNICPELLNHALDDAAKRGTLPKAIIVVDLYGQCADYDSILEMCGRYDVPVIEDAAEAFGAIYKGRAAGSFGSLSILSFNGNKIITTSGGGALLSKNKDWIERARFLATQAREPALHYEHTTVGYNYRLSNLLAAVGRGQLKMLDERIAQKRTIFSRYYEALHDVIGLEFMPEQANTIHTRWLTTVLIDPEKTWGVTRDDVHQALAQINVESRPVWKPMHLQPVFSNNRAYLNGTSERLFQLGLCLPSWTAMTKAEQTKIIDVIRSCFPSTSIAV